MRISQGYVSKSVMDFPFHEVYKLDDYNCLGNPCVFFGMYRYEDFTLAAMHHGQQTVFWTGQDALDSNDFPHRNVTAHPKVAKRILSFDEDCKLVKPAAFLNEQKPQVLGKKIYAYCPASAPDYHGKKIIDELRCGGYEILIGDGTFTQAQWRNGIGDFHYKDCYIGLCLSEFAGGGGTIIEMGLRGLKVVTNVFDLPNCIPWDSINDVVKAIEDETQFIGHRSVNLAEKVWRNLDHKHEWLNI